MAVLDSSVVNVALPDMSGTLGATIEEITWVVTGYILAQVILMPITALLSARFGRKRFYMASVVLFTARLDGLRPGAHLPVMVLFRAIQGAGGGVMITVSQAILRETFPPEEQGTAMGLYGVGMVLAPAIGPTLGGWLTDQYSWPWVFYVNVPIGVVAVLLVKRFIEDPPYLVAPEGADRLGGARRDGAGARLVPADAGEGPGQGLVPVVVHRLAGRRSPLVGLVAFVWRELRTERPGGGPAAPPQRPVRLGHRAGRRAGDGAVRRAVPPAPLPPGAARLSRDEVGPRADAAQPRDGGGACRSAGALQPARAAGAGGRRPGVSAYSFWELAHLTTDIGIWDLLRRRCGRAWDSACCSSR